MGKTTFIQNLFAAYAQDPNLKVAGVPGPTSKAVFASNPQQLCTTIDVTDEANRIRFHYSVQVRADVNEHLGCSWPRCGCVGRLSEL